MKTTECIEPPTGRRRDVENRRQHVIAEEGMWIQVEARWWVSQGVPVYRRVIRPVEPNCAEGPPNSFTAGDPSDLNYALSLATPLFLMHRKTYPNTRESALF